MYEIGLHAPERLAPLLHNHEGALLIACGHFHRLSHGLFAGHPFAIAPGASHSIMLDPEGQAPLSWIESGAGLLMHSFEGELRSDLILTQELGAATAFR